MRWEGFNRAALHFPVVLDCISKFGLRQRGAIFYSNSSLVIMKTPGRRIKGPVTWSYSAWLRLRQLASAPNKR
jgi:hypothetical protein